MEQEQFKHYAGVVEALLFVSEKPVSMENLKAVLSELSVAEIKELVDKLRLEYEERERGISILEIAEGYQMLSNSRYAESVRRFFKTTHKERLSRPALETLAIVAYKQPVSRGDIEVIRNVNSDGVVIHLLEKGLIKIVGRKDVPGKPYLYGTTKEFLEYFGLKSLTHLPKLEDFPKLMPVAQEGIPANQESGNEPAANAIDAAAPQENPAEKTESSISNATPQEEVQDESSSAAQKD